MLISKCVNMEDLFLLLLDYAVSYVQSRDVQNRLFYFGLILAKKLRFSSE